MAHLFLFLFAAAVLCTAQLCLGLWIGAKFGRIHEQLQSTGNADHLDLGETASGSEIPWTQCLILIDSLTQQVQNLALSAGRCQPALPNQISVAVSELQKLTVALQQQVAAGATNSQQRPSDAVAHDKHESAVQSPRDPGSACLQDLRAGENGRHAALGRGSEHTPESSSDEEQHTFTYDAVGYMAPCEEREVPHSDAFRPVICHAISVHTISFYADSPPDYAYLTISVGPAPQVIFILCRVESWREVYLEQQHRYLVGCEFVRRLAPEEICWQDVYGATIGVKGDRDSLSQTGAVTMNRAPCR